MSPTGSERPLIAVSACLLGQPVRYDGGHKRDAGVIGLLVRVGEVLPLCPEAGAGLGVPRPPVRLTRQDGDVRALGVEDAGLDVTGVLTGYARQLQVELDQVCGLVSKSRSPSCGQGSTPLYDRRGRLLSYRDGLFVEQFRQGLPLVPMVEESDLADPVRRKHFLEQVFCLHHWHRLGPHPDYPRLMAFHRRHQPLLRRRGKHWPQRLRPTEGASPEEYIRALMQVLRTTVDRSLRKL
jgi:uncharacterized protein YbbK (DUF523 family)